MTTASPHLRQEPFALLLSARPDDTFLRYDVSPKRVERVLVDGTAVAWTSTHPFRGVRWATGVADGSGAAAAVIEALVRVASDAGDVVSGVTVPWEELGSLPGPVRPVAPHRWCWWWTASEPVRRRGERTTIDLADSDPRITPLLRHSDSASVLPGDPRVRRWLGVLEGDDLVACAAHTEHQPGVPHLASVVTRPDRRGRGLAGDLCARLTRDALGAGAPVVTLGMYSHNDIARRVYAGLGFVIDKDFQSGYLPGHEPERA